MKRAFKISAVLTAFAIMVGGAAAVSASDKEFDPERDLTGTDYYDYFYDYEPAEPFTGIGWFTADGKFFSSDYMEIWKKQIFDKDFTIESSQQLRIEPIGNSPDTMSGGRLVISGGATAEIRGRICVERGGVLEIEDGTLYIDGGRLDNYGTVKIGKKGRLVIQSGVFNSTAAGNIENEGKMLCLDSEKNIDKFFKSIKKYDDNFNLCDYSLNITVRGENADVALNYCINDVETDYSYKFTLDINKKKTEIIRKPYDIEAVYSKETEEDILSRAAAMEKARNSERDNSGNYFKDYGYSYSYKDDSLAYYECWAKI